jgi:hypothetical protein
MPLPPDGAPAGSVPLGAIDAGHVADLLAGAAALAAALVGQPVAEAACADAASDYDGLEDLHIALAVAAADLDEAIAGHRHPAPLIPGADLGTRHSPPARTLRTQNRKRRGVSSPAPRIPSAIFKSQAGTARYAIHRRSGARPGRARREDNRDTQHQP